MVSISMNQSSNFVECSPSNVGISLRLVSLCVVCRVSVYACMVLCTGSSLDWVLVGAQWRGAVVYL